MSLSLSNRVTLYNNIWQHLTEVSLASKLSIKKSQGTLNLVIEASLCY